MNRTMYLTSVYHMAMGLIMVVKMSLVGWWPFLSRMQEVQDSKLFIKHAVSILEGNWLGDYNSWTLIKGPMTSIWLALCNYLGWPSLFAREILYLGCCLLAIKALSLVCRNKFVLLIVFFWLVFYPTSMAYGPFASYFRAAIHQPLVLGIQALLMVCVFKYAQNKRVCWHEPILLGLMLFAFFTNREEGAWIYPQLIWLSLSLICLGWWKNKKSIKLVSLGELAKVFLIPTLIVWSGVNWISNKNYEAYGIDSVVEITQPEFKSAYKAFLSIKPDKEMDDAGVPLDVLKKLKSLPIGDEFSAEFISMDKGVSAVQVPWVFRGIAERHYDQGGATVLNFYERLGTEVNNACEQGTFKCRPVLFGAIPVFDSLWPKTLEKMRVIFKKVIGLNYTSPSFEYYPSFADQDYVLTTSLLSFSTMSITDTDLNNLPIFYSKLTGKKIDVAEDIRALYLYSSSGLTYVSLLVIVVLMVRCLINKKAAALEIVLLGLFGSLFIQLIIYSILASSGLSGSTRLYFNSYPLLMLLIPGCMIYASQVLKALWTKKALNE